MLQPVYEKEKELVAIIKLIFRHHNQTHIYTILQPKKKLVAIIKMRNENPEPC